MGATLAILYATLMPVKGLPKLSVFSYDKIGHFIMFGVWTFLYGLVLGIRKKEMPNLWSIFFLGTFFGGFIEFLQFILPTKRAAELYDFIADMAGAAAAIPILYLVLTRYLKDET